MGRMHLHLPAGPRQKRRELAIRRQARADGCWSVRRYPIESSPGAFVVVIKRSLTTSEFKQKYRSLDYLGLL